MRRPREGDTIVFSGSDFSRRSPRMQFLKRYGVLCRKTPICRTGRREFTDIIPV